MVLREQGWGVTSYTRVVARGGTGSGETAKLGHGLKVHWHLGWCRGGVGGRRRTRQVVGMLLNRGSSEVK